MNTKNNKRRKASIQKIEKAFMELLQGQDVHTISITAICKTAHVNRTTFYANYLDIIDLIDKIEIGMMNDFYALYEYEEKNLYNSNDYLKLFQHIKDNQLFYKSYFKLGLDNRVKAVKYDIELAKKYYENKHIEYHMEYFKAGITALIKKWLGNDCDLEPQELFQILKEEYSIKLPIVE